MLSHPPLADSYNRKPGMKAVSSMLFDMDEGLADEPHKSAPLSSIQRVQELLAGASAAASQVSAVLAQLTQQDDLVAAAQAMGFSVRLRDCVGGGQGAACLHNLRHSFLILSPSPHHSSNNSVNTHAEEIIIDPTFKDQFVIAHPSPRYTAVLEALPPVWIGTPSKVQPLVELLCSEMALAFSAAGIVMPPWRSLRSMMTKWLPRRSLDLPLAGCTGGGVSTATAVTTTTAPGSASTAATAAAAAAAAALARAGTANGGSTALLLRRACIAAEASGHSSTGLSSGSNNTIANHSASSSNCSSISTVGAGPHSALMHTDPSSVDRVGGESAAAAGDDKLRALGCRGGILAGPMEVSQVLSNHRAQQAAAGHAAAAPCPSIVGQTALRFEPLHRVVGGFGFGTTPPV